jgi:DNA modification methylase
VNCEFPEGTTEHPINRNRKEKLLVSVWDFGSKLPQTERKHYLCNDHPAKMRPILTRAILRIFGESPVLDPMAGIGTTLVEAMLLGLNVLGVEYEKAFVERANKNIQHIRKAFGKIRLGNAICNQGDARNLNYEDDSFNSILFSPPYGEQHGKGGSIFNEDGSVTPKFRNKFKSSGIRRKGFLDTSSPDNIDKIRYGRSYLSAMLKAYSECYRVLAPSKFMVVVVKDIRRNSSAIPLAADTIKLCQLAGFSLFDIIINKTYYRSFWALNRAKKDQAKRIMHPLRNHEYVLVFRRPISLGKKTDPAA